MGCNLCLIYELSIPLFWMMLYFIYTSRDLYFPRENILQTAVKKKKNHTQPLTLFFFFFRINALKVLKFVIEVQLRPKSLKKCN